MYFHAHKKNISESGFTRAPISHNTSHDENVTLLQSKKCKLVGGFTLIEVMVSVSIFVIVVTVGIGSLITINNGYRKSQAQRAAIDNVSFALETMAREIRIGDQYACGTSPDSAQTTASCGDDFAFRSFDINDDGDAFDEDTTGEDNIYFTLDTVQGSTNQAIVMNIAGLPNRSGPITSVDDINVTDLDFDLVEDYQPYVLIRITAEAVGAGGQSSSITMQTGVSQRLLVNTQ